jgi:hypothetical protein
MPVPYLVNRPEIIPIDVGRQLFVDDFLVEETTLVRSFHRAEKHPANPIFQAETTEEIQRQGTIYLGHGGVFYDPQEALFKMFYVAGWRGPLSLATSTDMVHWSRPEITPGRGNVLIDRAVDDNSIWLDLDASNPDEHLKFLECHHGSLIPEGITQAGHYLYTSRDGREWSDAILAGIAGDYCSFFYNPFRKRWVFSIKPHANPPRVRRYQESEEFGKGVDWANSVHWTGADRLDLPEPVGRYPGAGEPCQLYSLNAVAYESIMVGMHYILRGPNNDVCEEGNFPKLTDLEVGFSRDGFHWDRPDRSGFIRGERKDGAWDRAYLHSTAGVFVVLDDQLVFPYTGFSGIGPDGTRGMYHGASMGLATLRRDGFASMEAGEAPGTLTTRPVLFSGSHLFVNAAVPGGQLRVEVRDMAGEPIAPFTLERSIPFTGDSTIAALQWKGPEDLSTLAGKPVRFHFELSCGALYAFWVSKNASGRSDGYVAAGGPGYPGVVDTVGKKALTQAAGSGFDAKVDRFGAMTSNEVLAYEADVMQRVADLTLLPPTLNTDPLPEYDYDRLDYAMNEGIERTAGGRLWALWDAGEDGPLSFMVAATSDDDGETWSKPRLVIDGNARPTPVPKTHIIGNLWTDPSGRLWLFFDSTLHHHDGRSGVWISVCENPDADQPEWSKPRRIWHGAVLNKPIVLSNGEWLLPVELMQSPGHGATRTMHEDLEALRGANVLVSSDEGKTWSHRGSVRSLQPDWPEHQLVELKDGRIWMIFRDKQGANQSFSSDGGRTWTPAEPANFQHPVSRFQVQRLASGRILLLKHGEKIDEHDGRSKLTAWLSDDEGQSWHGGLLLDEREKISYPDAVPSPEGKIYITYDRERSPLGEILMAKITEEDILAGKLVNPDSRLKMVVVKTPKKST